MSEGHYQESTGVVDEIQEAEVVQDARPEDARNAAPVASDMNQALQVYQKVGIVAFEQPVLAELSKWEHADDANHLEDMYDILPTGELYLSHVFYRRILNAAFGQGGWAIVPMDPKPVVNGNQLVQEWALIAHDRFISSTVGGAEYQPDNSRMLWSDACETVKSNALMRLCKDLALAGDCWDRRYIQAWKKKHAIAVWVAKSYKDRGDWKVKGELQWRRTDADPLRKELRVASEGEVSVVVKEVSFGVYEIIEKGGKPPVSPAVSADKLIAPPESGLPTSQPADEERQPLLAMAQRAGHNAYFTAKGITIVDVRQKQRKDREGNPKKDGAGNPMFDYTAQTANGEYLTFFSTTDARALAVVAREKRSVDLQLKAVLKGEKWFINIEEIIAEA